MVRYNYIQMEKEFTIRKINILAPLKVRSRGALIKHAPKV